MQKTLIKYKYKIFSNLFYRIFSSVNRSKITLCISICIVIVSLYSCGVAKNKNSQSITALQPAKTTEITIINALEKINNYNISFFGTKVSAYYTEYDRLSEDTTKHQKLKASLKIVPDSAIHVLATFAGIPVASSLLTTDSLILVNNRQKCFINTTPKFITNYINIPVFGQDVEKLLIGRAFYLPTNQQNVSSIDSLTIQYTTEEKNQIEYKISEDFERIEQINVKTPQQEIQIKYDNYNCHHIDNSNQVQLPQQLDITVFSSTHTIFIELNYDKIELNLSKNIAINIPKSYEKCN